MEYIEPQSLSHEPEKILYFHDVRTQHHVCHQVLVKRKDRLNKVPAWQNIHTLKKRFLLLFLRTKNLPQGRINVKTRVPLIRSSTIIPRAGHNPSARVIYADQGLSVEPKVLTHS